MSETTHSQDKNQKNTELKNNESKNNESKNDGAAPSPGKTRNQLENLDTMVQDVMQIALRVVDSVSEEDAQRRVQELRQQRPEAPREQIATLLIQKKCMETGAIGAVTSGASVIPGLGSIAALTVGAVADISLSMRLQAELVLEIAALCEHEFAPQEKRQAILVAAGIGAGAERMMARYGIELTEEVTERFAGRSLVKAVPFVGVAASAGLNVLITYLVGRRALAYFQLGPEAVGDWTTSLRAITGIDERAIGQWLTNSAAVSWRSIRRGATTVGGQLGKAANAGVARIRGRGQQRQQPERAESTEAVEIPIVNLDASHPYAPPAANARMEDRTEDRTARNDQ